MKILGIERDDSACNFYRILMPLDNVLKQNLADVAIIHQRDVAMDRSIKLALEADVIVFQRPANEEWLQFIKTCRKYGKHIVADYDDDPFNTSPLNPFYQYIGTEPVEYTWADGTKEMLWSEDMVSGDGNKIFNIERNIAFRDMFRLNFKKADMVTCTTSILQNEFLKITPNVSVLPNVIDPTFWPTLPEFPKREVRIGWQGGWSHYEDLYEIVPVIKNVLEKHDNVKFVYFGDQRFRHLFKGCDQNKIEWQDWVHHETYPYKMTLLNLDIGICPLANNSFNWTKSAIKWMEYSMLGCATVAANIEPYAPAIKSGETGFLVSDNSEWEMALDALIENGWQRRLMAKRAFADVMENHNIQTKAKLWVEAYDAMLRPKEVTV
ncbi:glycosyltransferase [Candidatus Parcubacteria bacterium]|nr:glycosyltransferase [Candidatus Parcubacteria bacterium]